MKISFRADSSVFIGTGHIHRCLVLAKKLASSGHEISFFCRDLQGNISYAVSENGFDLLMLPDPVTDPEDFMSWIMINQISDAFSTKKRFMGKTPDLMIVDHYSISEVWENEMIRDGIRVMAIDDLADRKHNCSILLDQNYYKDQVSRYHGLVPENCRLLTGPGFILLRDEFSADRNSVSPRTGDFRKIFLFFGGGDPDNVTATALKALEAADIPDISIDCVVGAANPNWEMLQFMETDLDLTFHRNTSDMAGLMSAADLCIGAGGVTTFERCCLGLPSLVITLAKNQEESICDLHNAGYLHWIGRHHELTVEKIASDIRKFISSPEILADFSKKSMGLSDGYGADRVTQAVTAFLEEEVS